MDTRARLESEHTERSPLIHRQSDAVVYNGEAGCPDGPKQQLKQTTWQKEAKTIMTWSGPMIVSYLLQRSIYIVSVLVVARLGTQKLGAASVGSLTTNMIGNTLVQGMANALDTLAGQAYGSGQLHLVGLHTQRMIAMIHICVFPLLIVWWNADAFLPLIIPEEEVASLAALYLRIMILRAPAFILFECGKRFTQAQKLFYPSTYVLLIVAPLNALLHWLFVWRLEWGFVGAPMAVAICENLMALLLFLYIWLIKGSECWGGISRAIFKDWMPMIRLAVPAAVMHMTEFAIEEIITLAAAQLGAAHLAAQSALVTLLSLTYIVPLGASVAASTRVAHWIGAQAPEAARLASKVSLILAGIITVQSTLLLLCFRTRIPELFTTDEAVAKLILVAFPILLVMQVFDVVAAFSHGLLRGIGALEIAGYVNIVAYYLFALPISFATAFLLDWGIVGLWTGIVTGMAIVCVIELWWLGRSDWNRASEKALSRSEGYS